VVVEKALALQAVSVVEEPRAPKVRLRRILETLTDEVEASRVRSAWRRRIVQARGL